MVSLKVLAEELGMDRSHLRKFVLSLGIEPDRIRTADSKNQLTLALSDIDAERVRYERRQAGFSVDSKPTEVGSGGYFYIVLLDPIRPNRVKMGFTNNMQSRLAAYRTSNPDVRGLGSWPCKRQWEVAAMAAITNTECKHVAGEIYDCPNLDDILSRAQKFFDLMP